MKKIFCLLASALLLIVMTSSAQNNALNFDGINDYVSIPASANYDLSSGTIECMINVTNFDNGTTILGVRGSGDTRYSFHLDANSIGMWNGTYYLPVSHSFAIGTWYHLAFVSSGSGSTKIYVDGSLIGDLGYGFSSVTGQTLIIGAVKESGTAQELFAGGIDEVRIWNTLRTTEEILENKDISLTGSETGLVALFNFNRGNAGQSNTGETIAYDATSNANNGTLNGFALTGTSSNYVASSLATGASLTAAWLMGGNAGTLPTINFLGTTDSKRLVFKTNNSEKMTILSNGNVGIGTTSPTDPVTIRSSALGTGLKIQSPIVAGEFANNYIKFSANQDFPQINEIVANGRLDVITNQQMFLKASNIFLEGNTIVTRTGNPGTGDPHSKSSRAMPFESLLWNGTSGVYQYAGIQNRAFDSTNLLHRLAFILKASNTDLGDGAEALSILSSGNVGIGIINPDVRLAVKGNIKAQKVTITQTGWADYVFHESYKLRPLAEVEKFIKINQHLPDMPSAAEVSTNGIDIGENQALLLRKVEELSLYIINVNKRIINHQKEIRELKKQLQKIKR